jgi:hypothetical protein
LPIGAGVDTCAISDRATAYLGCYHVAAGVVSCKSDQVIEIFAGMEGTFVSKLLGTTLFVFAKEWSCKALAVIAFLKGDVEGEV